MTQPQREVAVAQLANIRLAHEQVIATARTCAPVLATNAARHCTAAVIMKVSCCGAPYNHENQLLCMSKLVTKDYDCTSEYQP